MAGSGVGRDARDPRHDAGRLPAEGHAAQGRGHYLAPSKKRPAAGDCAGRVQEMFPEFGLDCAQPGEWLGRSGSLLGVTAPCHHGYRESHEKMIEMECIRLPSCLWSGSPSVR